MTDTASDKPVHITAEERPHPALQKLARACIALARLRRDEERAREEQPEHDTPLAADDGDAEVCHG